MSVTSKALRAASAGLPLLLHARSGFAIDSYRYLHVSIETPWMIFIFLLIAVFIPFILMLYLMWRPPNRAAAKPKARSDE